MTAAQKVDGAWTEIPPGAPIRHGDDVASYDTVMTWSVEESEAFGVFEVADGYPAPAGQRIVSMTIGERSGRPMWINVFGPDITAEALAPITRRQFFQALAMQPFAIISTQDALDAVKTGEIPAVMQTVIDALPAEAQFGATMLIAGAQQFNRTDPLVAIFGASRDMDAAAVDAFWRFAQRQ